MSKTSAYELASALCDKGFFKVIKEPAYRSNGQFSPRHYKVLSHDQWAAEHPDQCSRPVPPSGQAAESPVQIQDQPARISDEPVRIPNSPVRKEGHNPINNNPINNNPITQPYTAPPVQPGGQADTDAFISRYSSHRAVKKAQASACIPEPVPVSGHGESGTPPRSTEEWAERLAHQLTGSIGTGLQLEKFKKPWRDAIISILNSGYTPQIFHDVVKLEIERYGEDNFRSLRADGLQKFFHRMHSDWQNSQLTKQEIA